MILSQEKAHSETYESVQEITCIICPKGCSIKVIDEKIRGFQCLQGKKFAEEEVINPSRTLTTTISMYKNGKYIGELPVKTSVPISKEYIIEVMKELSSVNTTPPVQIGDVVADDLLGKDINLVATQTVK